MAQTIGHSAKKNQCFFNLTAKASMVPPIVSTTGTIGAAAVPAGPLEKTAFCRLHALPAAPEDNAHRARPANSPAEHIFQAATAVLHAALPSQQYQTVC